MPIIDGVNYAGNIVLRNRLGQIENVNPEFLQQKLGEGATIIENYDQNGYRQTYDRSTGNIGVNINGAGIPDILRNQSYNANSLSNPSSAMNNNVQQNPQNNQQGQQQYDLMSEINKAADARRASRSAALRGILDKTNTNLAAERATIAPQYQNLKNNESANTQLRARRVGEIMAAKGYGEGYQGQSEIASNTAYRGALNNLNTGEQNAYNDIAKRGTDAQTEYLSGLDQANADTDTWAAEQRLNELGTLRDYSRDDARYADTRGDIAYNRQYQQGRDQIGDRRYDTEYGDSRNDTAFNQDLQNRQLTYQQDQQRIDNDFRTGQFDFQREQARLDNDFRTGQFDYAKERDKVTDDRYKDEWKQKLSEWTFEKGKQQWMAQLQQNQFNYQKERDKAQQQNYDKEWLQKMDEWAWQTSENNPQVKGQILNNQISALQLKAMPRMQELELQELQKRIAQIGAVKPLTEQEKNAQAIELEIMREQLYNMRTGKTKDGKSTDTTAWTEQDIASYRQKATTYLADVKYDDDITQADIDAQLKIWGVPATAGNNSPNLGGW
jgi:hypothetical protein